ncbi:MAG: transcriptional regulator [Limnochordia bacterium]
MQSDLVRIGDKLISRKKIVRTVERILSLRSQGSSQQETADLLGLDRSFVSRLEGMGEVRKGERLALIGFPILNVEELQSMALEEGVDFVLILNEKQRWSFVTGRTGADLFNEVAEMLAGLRQFDAVIFLGSDRRLRWAESVWDNVLGMEIGLSPITEDKYVDPELVCQLIRSVRCP